MMWLICAAVFLIALYFLMRRDKENGKKLPGPVGLPVVGNAFQFSGGILHLKLSEWAYEHGPIYAISMFGKRLIILNNEEIIRKATSTEEFRHVFSGRKATFYGDYFLFGSQSIGFTNDPVLHQKLRKAFTKGLHIYGDGIQAFEDVITEEIAKTVAAFGKLEGQDVNPIVFIKAFLSNVISILLSGKPLNNAEVADDTFWKFVLVNNTALNRKVNLVASTFPFLRHVPGYLNRLCNQLDKFKQIMTLEYVTKMKGTYEPNKIRGFVDYLIQSQLEDIEKGQDVLFTDERIFCMVSETIAAGLNTSITTLSSIVLCLINDQECQGRMYKEILKVIGPNRSPTLQDKSRMPFTEAVIYESLRYAPPLPLSVPHFCIKDTNFEDYTIRAGDLIVLNLWHMQHDKSIWSDPFVFKPERFLDGDGQMLPPSHRLRKNWMPFSNGRRQCVGESLARSKIFLLITSLFQHYRFLPPTEGQCMSSDADIVIKPKEFKCRIQARCTTRFGCDSFRTISNN